MIFKKNMVYILISILLIYAIYSVLFTYYKITADKVSASQFQNITIGHRGYKSLYPENTLAGIKQAYLAGADGVEFDVRLTKDTIPVIIHDRSLKRTTNGSGKINELTHAETQKFNNKHGDIISNEKIPTLYQAIELIKKYNLKANIELKHTRNKDDLVQIITKIIKDNKLYNQVYISSFHPDYLYKIRKIEPKIITALNIGEIFKYDFVNYVYNNYFASSIADFLNISILGPDYKLLNNKTIEYYQKKHLVLIPYTVNNIKDKKLFKNNKISYITDDVSSN